MRNVFGPVQILSATLDVAPAAFVATARAAIHIMGENMSSLELDTPLIGQLRDHLLRLAKASFVPVHGGRRVRHDSPEEQAVLDRFRPFAELFLLVAAADGKIVDAERAVILGSFRALTGGRVSGTTLRELESEISEKMEVNAAEDLLEEVCSRLAADRKDAELALTLASVVASADDDVDPSELELIQTLASWLSIPRDRVKQLVSGTRDGGGT